MIYGSLQTEFMEAKYNGHNHIMERISLGKMLFIYL